MNCKKLFSGLIILLVSASLFYAKAPANIKMPQKVKAKLVQTKATEKSFYIAPKKKKIKPQDVLAGPFETAEQVVLVWIHNGFHANTDVCITKDITNAVTANPIIYFNKIYPVIAEEYKVIGFNAAFDKYFFGETISEFNSSTTVDEKAIEKELDSEVKKQLKNYEDEMVQEAAKQIEQADQEAKIAKPQGEGPEETTVSEAPEEIAPEIQEEIKTKAAAITALISSEETPQAESEVSEVTEASAPEVVDLADSPEPAAETYVKEEQNSFVEPVKPSAVPAPVTETKTTPVQKVQIENLPIQKEPDSNIAEVDGGKDTNITPLFDIQISKESQSAALNRYQKEYLQDYMPVKKLELPKDEISTPMPVIENPDQKDENGRTLLMKAAKSGNNWEIDSLLNSGADVNLADKDGWTALMYAVRYQENITVVNSLIKAGAKVKIKNNYEMTPLLMASTYNGNPEIIKALLNYYSASEKEVMQAFVLLLSDNSISEFSKNAKISMFISKSIPLNTFYNGKTPLMYSAQYGTSTAIIKLLLDNGSITSIRSTEGKTAYDYAKENKRLIHDDIYWALNKK